MNEGKKYDGDKLRYDLLPWAALDEVIRVLGHGARKYGDENWRRVDRLEDRYPAAALRHLSAYLQGQEHDQESGFNHLAHAICSLMFVLQMDKETDIELAERMRDSECDGR